MAKDTFSVSTAVDAECGLEKANAIAFEQVAIATIKNGFDTFMIVDLQTGMNSQMVGTTPIQANPNGLGGFNLYGGQPIISSQYNKSLVVKMFRANDPNGANAIDARSALGADWRNKINKKSTVCF